MMPYWLGAVWLGIVVAAILAAIIYDGLSGRR